MQNQRKAMGYGFVTVLLWSTVASAFKLSLRYLDFSRLLLFSTVFSILSLGAILAFKGKMGLLFSCSARQYLRSAFLGFLNPFLYYLILFKAYDILPAQEAQPLNYTWAITLVFIHFLVGEAILPSTVVGLIFIVSGILIQQFNSKPGPGRQSG